MGQIEARLRSGMQERGITGAAQDEIVRGITSFALYGFPESHSASFALIAYASAYLRAHHPAAFLAGMLNAYPLGFYSAATLVKDAQRHGVAVLPIDVTRSEWECTLENGGGPGPAHASAPWLARSSMPSTGSGGDGTRPSGDVSCCALLPLRHAPAAPRGAPSVRVGLRYVRGLSADTGRRLVGVREASGFSSLADFAARVGPKKNELEALAEAGALAGIDARAAGRRSALWQVGALERDPRSLFAGVPPPDAEAESPLEELGALETTLADYRSTGLTTGPHVMAHLRPGLAARGVLSARELRAAPNGRFVRAAGHVIVRQRPGSAKGFCFVTLEDETGTLNGVFTPDQFERLRGPLHAAPLIEIAGPVQNVDGVIHVRVREVRPLGVASADQAPDSHDYR
jgi:error-prone DNA polymerase